MTFFSLVLQGGSLGCYELVLGPESTAIVVTGLLAPRLLRSWKGRGGTREGSDDP